jgi:predicted glycosyltransferase
MLASGLPLEIVKLPSYNVAFSDGASVGTRTHMNFGDDEIAILRSKLIATVVAETYPRCILVDHMPAGKRNELVSSQNSQCDIIWVLGLRAASGDDFEAPVESLKKYKKVFWYADRSLHKQQALTRLPDCVISEPVGYVSRAFELEKWGRIHKWRQTGSHCCVAFSWISEGVLKLLKALLVVIAEWDLKPIRWNIFLGRDYTGKLLPVIERLSKLKRATIEPLSDRYLSCLTQSDFAVVAGGYNSLTDLLWSGSPAVVVCRETQDREQETHMQMLLPSFKKRLNVLLESEASPHQLKEAICCLPSRTNSTECSRLNGSVKTARSVCHLLKN